MRGESSRGDKKGDFHKQSYQTTQLHHHHSKLNEGASYRAAAMPKRQREEERRDHGRLRDETEGRVHHRSRGRDEDRVVANRSEQLRRERGSERRAGWERVDLDKDRVSRARHTVYEKPSSPDSKKLGDRHGEHGRRSYAQVASQNLKIEDESAPRRHLAQEPIRNETREDEEGEWILVKRKKKLRSEASKSNSTERMKEEQIRCHKCARTGHSINSCKFDWFCYRCKLYGHISSDCPKAKTTNSASGSKTTSKKAASPISIADSPTQESSAGERNIIRASISPTPLIAEMERRYKNCLIARARTGNPQYSDIKELLSAMVSVTACWTVQEASGGTFVVHCNEGEAMAEALQMKGLEGRDIYGMEFYITLAPWSRHYGAFNTSNLPTLWIRLFNLPLHLWVKSGFSNMIRSFGTLVEVDKGTVTHECRKFARLRIAVANKADIPSKIIVDFEDEVYEVWVVVEAKKSVTFGSVAALEPARKFDGGDSEPEVEERRRPLDQIVSYQIHPSIPQTGNSKPSKQRDSSDFDRTRIEGDEATFQGTERRIGKSTADAFHSGVQLESREAQGGIQTGSVKLLSREVADDNQLYIKDSLGLPSYPTVEAIVTQHRTFDAKSVGPFGGILKRKVDSASGIETSRALGIGVEEWNHFTKEEVEESIRLAMSSIIKKRAIESQNQEHLLAQQKEEGAQANCTTTHVQEEKQHTSQGDRPSPNEQGDRGAMIGALDDIRDDFLISEADTETGEKELRGSVGSNSSKKTYEYQRRGKRQLKAGEGQADIHEGSDKEALNLKDMDRDTGGRAGQAKKIRLTEDEH